MEKELEKEERERAKYEKLYKEFKRQVLEDKHLHDAAVAMGQAGVSISQYDKYQKLSKEIKEYSLKEKNEKE